MQIPYQRSLVLAKHRWLGKINTCQNVAISKVYRTPPGAEALQPVKLKIPCSDSTALGHEQIGLELTAERLGPNGARRSQAAGNALAFSVQTKKAPNPNRKWDGSGCIFHDFSCPCVPVWMWGLSIWYLSTVLEPSRVGVYSLRLGSLFMPREGPPPTPDCPYGRKEEGLRGEKFQGEEFPQPLGTI